MIWRRLLVCGDSTIADLHYIIQIAMGCSGDHLHQFRIHGKRYGIALMGGISFSDDPMVRKGKWCVMRIAPIEAYCYDQQLIIELKNLPYSVVIFTFRQRTSQGIYFQGFP